jgi:hypothetical protein
MAPNTMAVGCMYVAVMAWDLQQGEYVVTLGGSKCYSLVLLYDPSHRMA